MPTLTAIDGHTLGTASGYLAGIPWGVTGAREADVEILTRPGGGRPMRDQFTVRPRTIPFRVVNDGTVAGVTFARNVEAWFAPEAGERMLTALSDDGSTTLELTVDVVRLEPVTDRVYEGAFLTRDPYWRATSDTTDAASPLTNAGNMPAYPVITLTPTATTVRRRRVTITDDAAGYGLSNYLVRITFDSTGVSATTAADYIVFYQGRAVPFRVAGENGASTTIDLRVDVPPRGSTFVDVYYGSSVNNTVTANTLVAGGLNLGHGSFSNTNWVWDNWSVSTHPNITGQWKLQRLALQRYGDVGIDLSSDGSGSVVFIAVDSAKDGLDAIVLPVGARAGAGTPLSGMSRAMQFAPNLRGRVVYRVAGQATWYTADTTASNVTDSDALGVASAVEIGVLMEESAAGATVDPSYTFTISGTVQLALAGTPTVSVGAATTARVFYGETLTNSTTGEVITLTDLYVDDVALTIDTDQQTVYPASGPWYGAVTFSDPARWWPLAAGANSWVGSSRVDLQACKLEYSIVSPK